MKIIEAIREYFRTEKLEYWHRDRSIETVAKEKGMDVEVLKNEIRGVIKKEGRVEAITRLRHRFHVPLNAAWRFIDKIDME